MGFVLMCKDIEDGSVLDNNVFLFVELGQS